ncbi:hypothetical protein E3P99_00014 [Wallemia hederae]|uniref:precorrin-2 dehydrogenase n=1 Tax=Wallemia hederae TaxID=1540922 RepID=A0A4T0FXV5_9BASI|nr:hypothetical protein E3P99_00014 [Wallemia hederae]
MSTAPFRQPSGGASLLIALSSSTKTVLVIGHNRLAASRAYAALDADCRVIVIGHGIDDACPEIRYRVQHNQVTYRTATTDSEAESAFRESVDSGITFATITDSSVDDNRPLCSTKTLVDLARSLNIPINVTDRPEFCDYTFPTTHRFARSDDNASPLQIAVTTNSKGCRLASRIKREMIAHLPAQIGNAVHNIGLLRSRAKRYVSRMKLERTTSQSSLSEELADLDNLNAAVPQLHHHQSVEDVPEKALRRMRWVAQISEYWPLEYLAKMDEASIDSLLDAYGEPHQPSTPKVEVDAKEWPVVPSANDRHALGSERKGHIVLVGAGLGSPELLTIAAYRALMTADLVLSDKLVPAAVLKLIPKSTEVRIARKFPGNAEGAQAELMNWAVEGARAGKVVVRCELKQGDPFVYGRGGEEVVHFRAHGYEAVVVPGISSAMSAPLMAGIPVTQRGASDSYLLCTGVGRGGKALSVPEYVRARTLVILMGVARLAELVSSLDGLGYPAIIPVAIIEQASSSSQRVVMSTLKDIVAAYSSAGEQRPPGMIVVGWTILSLHGQSGDMTVLDDNAESQDEDRVKRWLNGKLSIVNEGPGTAWDEWLKEVSRPVVLPPMSSDEPVPAPAIEVAASEELSATTVPGLIPPTPALSTASSPQPSPLEAGPSTPAPAPAVPAATVVQDSPLAATLTSLIELAKLGNWHSLSHAALNAETMFAQVDAADKLWEGVYTFSALSDILIDNVPGAQATLIRAPTVVRDRLGTVVQCYAYKQYKDALQALALLESHPHSLINESVTHVFDGVVAALQNKILGKALNVVAVSCSAVPVSTVSESVGVSHDKLVTFLKDLNWRFSDDGQVVYPLTSSTATAAQQPGIQNIASSIYLLEAN